MVYLLDANVFITANNTYYPLERVPEFWEWLVHKGNEGNIKIIKDIYDEIKQGDDNLAQWSDQHEVRNALLIDDDVDILNVRRVLAEGYAPNLDDNDIEKLGRDPFIIAYAIDKIETHAIVTTEVSKSSKKGANRHIPDVCASLNIRCYNTFNLANFLDFKTRWKDG